ncbi:MAG: double-strand break repair helicase AddA [Rhodoplanes sp.]
MTRPRDIPQAITAVQADASDPRVSAFVSANAGSGKTHVLAQRVIRLLLDGVDPAKILCLTFTKAAAANMANRAFAQLAAWIALDDPALDDQLRRIGVRGLSAPTRARARKLFAAALETPGGLKVETIHAFCARLLQRFPFEAKTPADFAVLDERGSLDLLNRVTLSVLLDAAAAPEGLLGCALSTALTAAADTRLRELVREAVGQRDALTAWIAHAGGLDVALAKLSRTLNVAPDETRADIETEIVDSPLFPPSEWATVAELCSTSSPNDQDQCKRLTLAAQASGAERVDAYLAVFLDSHFEPRKAILTKPLARKHPESLRRERDRVAELHKRRQAIICRDRTASLITIADAVIKRYATEKNRRGLLDYDDLIDHALAMLERVDSAWVHYKLDRGIDHVLIDEAQDTSPKQWAIIRRLVEEFTAGEGARAVRRSLFAVGDEKQSIFSFQGAAPKEFAKMRRHFDRAHQAAGLAFVTREFKFSFRSGPNVLGAIDAVFEAKDMFASVTSDDNGFPPHEALPDAAPGLVEVWPLIAPEQERDIEGWDAPFDETPETSPRIKLAQKIAKKIRAAIDRREWVGSERRPLSAGDVLVLVRQRGPLFEAIIRALKDAGVAVAGADRLKLTEHIAVVDLMALADALLLPDDDLALAIALKSPLFGWDDALLFDLAYGRRSSLRSALTARAGERPEFADAAARLDRCAGVAHTRSPFAFFAWLLGAEGGRAHILARLGLEAIDALDEFLELALDYEQRETPTLQGFLAWLRAAESEINRDMEIARDEVRVMTVHGAKGLEAPLVILADTIQPPAGPRPPQLLPVPVSGAPDGAPAGLVWAGRKEYDGEALAAARAQALADATDEYRRLLYVGMTRAADRLIVCGCRGKKKPPDGCWHELVLRGLAGRPGVSEHVSEEHEGPVHVYRKVEIPLTATAPEAVSPAPVHEEPGWLRRPAPVAPAPIAPISPAHALDQELPPGRGPAGASREAALLRGRLVHRLLQSLPDLAPDRRAEAARGFLARNAAALTEAERERIAEETLAILDDPRFAALFAAGSRAEAPIIGRIAPNGGPSRPVSGQVDRLAVTPEQVLIADYKSNRPAPRKLAEIPPAYVAQLAFYRAVLTKLYPDRPVRAALVLTDAPRLIELPSEALTAALAHLTSP